MTKKVVATAFLCLAIAPGILFAQEKEPEKKDAGKDGSYIKLSFSQKNRTIAGLGYDMAGLEISFEKYLKNNCLGLSGWSIGLRKDEFIYLESGYLLNLRVFRNQKAGPVDAKLGIGAEWGAPPLTFDRTRFEFRDHELVSYKHVHIIRNSKIPRIGTVRDGVLYGFIEGAISKRKGPFLLEAGVRGNAIRFGIDVFHLKDDRLTHTSTDKLLIVPAYFVSLGVKLW
ncbi:MAG: hypothetical protein A3B99_02195 [Candidatus Yanofskybacteria bacterium RIFCSPHIGHO2_02_FULL_44_12b]|uniref:Outer membrane protein beta-barrel domain-containing protein n=2 Tax=Candidatus Yanofskyibacteriota TaxID=1752733 RepID=A0A1F8GNE6_9BACT|nr:MAG: hypothetical protein UW79_C0012G0031 [Candidatus Yanofskybacteria bacterium GW2011_GWA2_44_9]OGN05211.1 MAG: hypothetical protein A2659_04270 [Candidatus Yanofskybacteria bacterium RIFCSPHIGHO2_01_FULL_44_24]OGN15269.1 MAG: hypothetical protein A3B99_02195 [Candidatus Yanofskybacteria bacterium RIFCSPHIGHO2_02_FULL_44_12b]OGN26932.1 MAG: hypothetical protein A2925_01530 [Candidatus Yanofskybacteria bacterium RIFCSPLOWO2_01_FULL_44_22]